eukprot:TRINITY_DN20678_c0_g1_i2.p1 TRINITY_DN20678_c0_g1~~TRINITY_DN20678_c0_g1_i2.p1  ORF type:complete len:107 (-),score=18.40 TRINITY_DN20678_c0_g1_i2:42-362(-)
MGVCEGGIGVVEELIELETGQAFHVHLVKADGERISLVVSPHWTLQQLKQSIQNVLKKQETRHLSWKKGIWKHYCLAHNTLKLLDPGATLQEYGITKDSLLYFVHK